MRGTREGGYYGRLIDENGNENGSELRVLFFAPAESGKRDDIALYLPPLC